MIPDLMPWYISVATALLCGAVLLLGGLSLLGISTRLSTPMLFSLAVLTGLATDLLVVTLFQSRLAGTVVVLLLAIAGVVRLLGSPRSARSAFMADLEVSAVPLLVTCLLFVGLAVRVATLRTLGWDYLQNWAFHGIVLATEGHFGGSLIDYHVSQFLHFDYPPALGILLAQFSYFEPLLPVTGRAALPVLMLPCFFAVAALLPRTAMGGAVWLFTLFCTTKELWTGVLDVHLSTSYLISAVLLLLWVRKGDSALLYLSLVFVVYCFVLKNDGLIAAVCWGVGAAAGLLLKWRDTDEDCFRKLTRAGHGFVPVLATLAALLAAVVSWMVLKNKCGFESDLVFNVDYCRRVIERVRNFDAKKMAHFVFPCLIEVIGTVFTAWCVLSIASLCGFVKGMRRETAVVVLMAAANMVCLAVIYLGTPHSVYWHISTSLRRTIMLPLDLLLLFQLLVVAPATSPVSEREGCR